MEMTTAKAQVKLYVDYDEVFKAVDKYLMDENERSGAWFHSEKELENWAGDILYDAIIHTLEIVGYRDIEEEDIDLTEM